jgi:hypothetical protein
MTLSDKIKELCKQFPLLCLEIHYDGTCFEVGQGESEGFEWSVEADTIEEALEKLKAVIMENQKFLMENKAYRCGYAMFLDNSKYTLRNLKTGKVTTVKTRKELYSIITNLKEPNVA